MTIWRAVLAAVIWLTLPVAVWAQEQAWLQIEAQPSRAIAIARAEAYAAEFPDVKSFATGGQWHAIVLGPMAPEAAAGLLSDLRRSGRVPRDAFVSDGAKFAEAVYPEGSADASAAAVVAAPEASAEAAPVEEAAAPIADETPKEARASEAALSKDDRKALQAALKWYGFYDTKIDGSFGKGTRASMASWQEANGYEPTGILTSLQRATLVTNHSADLAEFGFETITEPEAGIEITLPMSLVTFDRYEPPFAHFVEKDGSGLQILLISEPGGRDALAGLYEVLQTLEVVPETGERVLKERSFTIEAAGAAVESFAFAETSDGMVKGYLVVWNPADRGRMDRILPALKTSFRGVGDKALDPGLVPLEDAARDGMLAGLQTRLPARVASGFFVDGKGHVLTALATVSGCGKVTVDSGTEAEILAKDDMTGVALLAPLAPLAPRAVATLSTASLAPGSEISVAGYSYGSRLPAAVLTLGTLDTAEGLQGEPGYLRLIAPLLEGDLGGPVFDKAGAVIGMALPAPDAAKVLPKGVALAADTTVLGALMQSAGLAAAAADPGAALPSPNAMDAAATGMTVLVTCWAE
jgi:peptidoglycan hydrolase-like protein with peptidoglycan-binding domain